MVRNLRIRVDHNICVGNAMCETFAPNVFRLNDDRQSEAVDPSGDSEEKSLEAAENCPVSAITVEDADTGEQLFPRSSRSPRLAAIEGRPQMAGSRMMAK